MILIEDILLSISKIIDDACHSTIFTNKCDILASTLKEMKDEIINTKCFDKNRQDDLSKLYDNLRKLSDIIGSFQKEQFFWSILDTDQKFQQSITSINNIMNEIDSLLQQSGIKKSFKLPKDDLFHDLDQIDQLLADTHILIQKRRKEVGEYMKQIHSSRTNINNLSTFEENIEELKKLPQYKLNKSDFTINPVKIDHNDEFLYYKGINVFYRS